MFTVVFGIYIQLIIHIIIIIIESLLLSLLLSDWFWSNTQPSVQNSNALWHFIAVLMKWYVRTLLSKKAMSYPEALTAVEWK